MGKLKDSKWQGRYRKIIVMLEKGMTQQEIAKELNMHYVTISKIIRREGFQTKKAEFEEQATSEARKLFEDKTVMAAKKIIMLAKSGKADARIQLDAAREILHQAGMKPVEKIETVSRDYSPEEVKSALAAMKEVELIHTTLGERGNKFVIDKNAPEKSDKPSLGRVPGEKSPDTASTD